MYQLLHGYLLLKPPHPSLPLTGQSHALRLEYFLKNTFTAATVKSILKKKIHNRVYYLHLTCLKNVFCDFDTSADGNKSLQEKVYLCKYWHYFWPLPFTFFLSLCCFTRLTTGNKFWKQEARSEDPSGVYIMRSAAWASPHKLDVAVGIFFNPIHYNPSIRGLGGSKFNLVVVGECLPLVPSTPGCITVQKRRKLPSSVKAGLGLTAVPAPHQPPPHVPSAAEMMKTSYFCHCLLLWATLCLDSVKLWQPRRGAGSISDMRR